jgi:two-component system sensor histidine kinase PilS (NtrC family)
MVVASAILLAAIFVWREADPVDTLVATLGFTLAMLATGVAYMYVEVDQRPLGRTFRVLHLAVDLALVTLAVWLTGGWSSQFAAIYVLVICAGALLFPHRGGMGTALVASTMYAAVVLLRRSAAPDVGLVVQVTVFLAVGAGLGLLVARLRQIQSGRAAYTEQLVTVQLEAADILRSIRSGILTVDAAGRLLYANPMASELLGFDLTPYLGRVLLPVLAPIAPALAGLLSETAQARQRVARAEGVIHRPGGDVEVGMTTTITESPAGGMGTATAIFQDISDSRRLQALNVRTERLQAVAELSASLAHEIRNPLASIRSATEQLARRQALVAIEGEADDADGAVLHALVVREADRLSRLLADFLDFARPQPSRCVPLDIGLVAREAASLASAHPGCADGVQLAVEVAPGLPLVEGDADLLHRAVFNLVLNALQAVGGGGRVAVRVESRACDEASVPERGQLARGGASQWVAISVVDDGPGIPPELRPRIFEPFVSGRPGGTGLGLPVVHRAVEAHHGLVLVDALARGTCFTLLLPVDAAGRAAADGGAEPLALVAGHG